MDAAAPPTVEVVEHVPAVAYSPVMLLTGIGPAQFGSVTASYSLSVPAGFEIAAGGRVCYGAVLANDGVDFEGVVSASMVPRFATAQDEAGRTAAWRPSFGVELGASTLQLVPLRRPPDSAMQRISVGRDPGPFFGLVAVRPARFRLNRFVASGLGVSFGTYFDAPGNVVRLQVELLSVGMAL